MPRGTRVKTPPPERPAGITEDQWKLASDLGNVSLAVRLDDAYKGDLPDDPNEAMELLEAAHNLARKSMAAYLKFGRNVRPRLENLRAEYLKHRSGADALFAKVSGTSDVGTNGTAEA